MIHWKLIKARVDNKLKPKLSKQKRESNVCFFRVFLSLFLSLCVWVYLYVIVCGTSRNSIELFFHKPIVMCSAALRHCLICGQNLRLLTCIYLEFSLKCE